MFSYFRKVRAYHKTRNELNGLTRRELDDIGIGTGDIEHIARQVFARA